MTKQITGIKGIKGVQGVTGRPVVDKEAVIGFLSALGTLLAVKVIEAFFATGHTVMKQATKNVEKKFQ